MATAGASKVDERPQITGSQAREALQILREMIRHEDDLRNQRLGYLLTLDGLLFAALGFAWGAKDAKWLVLALTVVGVVVALSATAAMHLSSKAIRRLRCSGTAFSDDLPLVGLTHEDVTWWEHLLQPWLAVPLTLMIVWPVICVIGFRVH
jgi:hypothetical protein